MEAVIQSTVRYLLLWHPSRVHSCNCCYSYLQFKVQDYQKSISPSTGCSSMTFNSSNYNKVWEHQPLSWNGVCGAWFEFVNWWQWTLCCMFIWTFWYKSFPSCKHLTIGVKPIGANHSHFCLCGNWAIKIHLDLMDTCQPINSLRMNNFMSDLCFHQDWRKVCHWTQH